ncbi:rhomboid-related protein 2-like [Centruroides sculpturatus]|uniref:rhomboid-related protein 2-like n=1 Tax=Centruroides sculpturatus TaxID=218467 RepID=UPI000C6D2B4D|nr:rhomboid-related protein 2-like [Centruroides sculpturatus]
MPSKVSPPPNNEEFNRLDRQWRPVFEKYDTDEDGLIALDELKLYLQNVNTAIKSDFPPEVIEEIIERADWDKNRHLSYYEFLKMVHAAQMYSNRPYFHKLLKFATKTVVPHSQQATVLRNYIQYYNCMPPPLFMIFITLIEIAVFIYYCVDMKELSSVGPVPIDSILIYNPRRRYQAWRYLTYMLIHAGIIHILFNILVQLLLGLPLELVHKWWRVGLVYLLGVIAGSLGSSITDPNTFLAGASGGVYALIAAHLANVIINFKEMEFGWLRLVVLFVFAATDIGAAIYGRYAQGDHHQTSYAAHLTGALGGLLVGLVVLRNIRVYKWEKILGWVMLGLFCLLILLGILFNILCPNYFPEPD